MMNQVSWLTPRILWWSFFLLSLLPAALLLDDALNARLGANPIQTLHFRTGDWALRFLLITLALTPMRVWFGQLWQQAFRRMMGLYAFFYATLHTLVYLVLDHNLSWQLMLEDIPRSPYVIVGLIAWVLLIPLAVTSQKGIRRRMLRYWKPLHRTVYLIAVLAVIHFYWLVKADLTEPTIYALILAALLLARIIRPSGLAGLPLRRHGGA